MEHHQAIATAAQQTR